MRKQFGHLLPLSDSEIDEIWKEATLTVDANVLLDLYRYHPETRDALLGALRAFHGRIWLSHQAAIEFVRNRADASAAVVKELSDADGDLKALESAAQKTTEGLRGRRPLPRVVGEKLKEDVETAVLAAKSSIEHARNQHAASAKKDTVLEDILALFDGCVGAGPTDEELGNLHKEGERRVKEKVPPGYQDARKDGVGAYGDYIVWQQTLQRAKSTEKTMIFVTSERKEDWWERAHGKTVGPRQELLEEAHRVAGQRVIIYHTDKFITIATKRAGGSVSALIRNDIRAPRDHEELEDIITSAVEELGNDLVDSDDQITALIAGTNASDWDVNAVEVIASGPFNYSTCTAPFRATVHFSGQQNEDSGWCGTDIRAEIRGTISFEDGSWEISDHDVVNADVDYGDDLDQADG